MDYKQRDLVTINFNPKKGEEVGKIRPALIISKDEENEILDTIIVIPLSTSLLDDMEPFRMRLKKRDNLQKDSDLLINHVRAMSKKRVGEIIGTITEKEFEEVVECLCGNFR